MLTWNLSLAKIAQLLIEISSLNLWKDIDAQVEVGPRSKVLMKIPIQTIFAYENTQADQ